MSSNKVFPQGCFFPMNALAIHPQGQAHFCLNSTMPAPKNLADLHQARQQTHQELQAGQWPAGCLRCQKKEQRDLRSRRQHGWLRKTKQYNGLENVLPLVENATEPQIRHLEISFSNACNLSCVMCSSEFSTGWIKPDKKAREEGLEFRNFTESFQQLKKISPDLLQEVLNQIENLDLIIIKGGEPTKEALCLDFLKEVARRGKQKTSIFIQSNGTTPPKRWLQGLENLELDVGTSIDGWNEVFDWIRGGRFAEVLQNLRELHDYPNVRFMTIDFTLSAFNVLHLPEFLEKVLELRKELPKIHECVLFQWAQQPFASVLSVPLETRLEILAKVKPLLEQGKDFFLDAEFLISLLQRPRSVAADIRATQRWFEYLKNMRGFSLGPTEEALTQALELS